MKKPVLRCVAVATIIGTLSFGALAQNVAIVNGKPIPKSRMTALEQQLARSGRPVTPDMQNQLRDELIAREILMQEASKRGIDATPAFKDQLELARQSILIRELFNDVEKKNPVTDAELKEEYAKFLAANSGKEYRARHILVDSEDEARKLIAQIKGGAKFEDVAKKASKDPGSGANGGDLDWASPNNFVPEFSDAMVKLGKGQMTDTPVKSQFGWHIIRLDDARDVKLPTFEELKDQQKAQLRNQLMQQKLAKFRDELRAKAKVE